MSVKLGKGDALPIGGLATDYCVSNTVRSALKAGFEGLLQDEIRAVDVKPGEGACATDEMRRAGAAGVTYDKLA
jgi:nicotinamidase/pyrazinamidase